MDWHLRYTQQARWTASLRQYLFGKAGMAAARRILEVGCGTGAILAELPDTPAAIHALDLSLPTVMDVSRRTQGVLPLCARGEALPYPDACFDLVFCHYLLLWAQDPLRVLSEMKRVTRSGGAVLAIAEPDYGGRIDHPVDLVTLGRWQAESLRAQGANPEMGRQLHGLFARAGISIIESGVIGGGAFGSSTPDEWEMEWAVLQADLAGRVSSQDIQTMKELDRKARQAGERVLFVPTFFAWGRA